MNPISVFHANHGRTEIVLVMMFLMLPALIRGRIDRQTTEVALECDEDEALTVFNIKMDDNPEETNWFLVDYTLTGVSMLVGNGQGESVNKPWCLDRGHCYFFEIRDLGGDGICCDSGNGYFNISYDGELIGEGGSFLSNDLRSAFFGDGCPTNTTSKSPSISLTPTSSPSISLAPTSNSMSPTASPTMTFSPTTLSSNATESLIQKDKDRRYFPKRPLRQEHQFSVQPLPDCNSDDLRVGCIAVPGTIETKPDWAGKIHFTHPKCSKQTEKCVHNLPGTKITHDDFPFSNDNLALEQIVLPGGYTSTFAGAAGDLDNDGAIDIVFANDITYFSQVLWNVGNGTFHEITNISSPLFGSRALALGDLDNDGWVDLVIGHYNAHVTVLMNNGDRTFTERILFPQSQYIKTQSIAIGDVNNDGWLDIVLGNSGYMNQLVMNKGDGSFQDPFPLSGTSNTATNSIKLGDLNRDGWMDVVVGNVAHGQKNEILINTQNETGSFLDAAHFPGGDTLNTFSIDLADVNGDDCIDIIEGNDVNQENRVLINKCHENGTSFSNETYILSDVEGNTRDIAAADINGDGAVDLIIGSNGQHNYLLINEGNGKFSQALRFPGQAAFTRSIIVADVDGDGDAEVIFGYIVNEQNSIYLNNEKDWSYLQDAVFLPNSSGATFALTFSDSKNNGWFDILRGELRGGKLTGSNMVAYNNGDGTYRKREEIPESADYSTLAIESADLNGDGYLDIVVGTSEGNNLIYWNNGEGEWDFDKPLILPGNEKTNTIALGDLDGDGYVDIVFGNEDESNLVFKNLENGTFIKPALSPLPGGKLKTESIVLGDLNGDGILDMVIGNYLQDNQVLIGNGDGSFKDAISLANSTEMETYSLALADLNGDSRIDLVVGNFQQNNVIYFNGDNTMFSEPLPLSGGNSKTYSVALGDVNGDNHIDIAVGNWYEPNQIFLNDGKGDFSNVNELPGGSLSTGVIRLADFDNDGYIDVGIGNTVHSDQLIYFSSCPDGGAQLHPKSWCFRCPSFMGRVSITQLLGGMELSTCKECLPDYMQEPGGNEKCAKSPCLLSGRALGENGCSRCPDGTSFNTTVIIRDEYDETTWKNNRCDNCAIGTYATQDLNAVDRCFPCLKGTYQDEEGESECKNCTKGEYQPKRGESKCEKCKKGGYCEDADTCGGGYEPCPSGTFNNVEGADSEGACEECPVGTYSFNTTHCNPCPLGSYNNETGQKECKLCPIGSYANENKTTSCKKCAKGTYADKSGLTECIPCPYRLNSNEGAEKCLFCDTGYFLKNAAAEESEIFKNSNKLCVKCPGTAECPLGTDIKTLKLNTSYWRDSENTSRIYQCGNKACEGSKCKVGHEGPLCQICTKKNHYFDRFLGFCTRCPSLRKLIPEGIAILLGLVMFVFLVRFVAKRKAGATQIISSLSLQAKCKIMLSFYQVANSLDVVYGVRIDERLKDRFNFLRYLSFDLIDFTPLPIDCMGLSMRTRLILCASLPWVIILLGILGLYLTKIMTNQKCVGSCRGRGEIPISTIDVKKKSIYLTVFLCYVFLPTVSRLIFDAIKCRSFKTNDEPKELYTSYLVADMTIRCDEGSVEMLSLKRVFATFFVLWPCLTPLFFLVLLTSVRQSIRNNSPSHLAQACRFLWEDYDESMLFWDVLDSWRKIFLTGMIMFFDIEDGSNKTIRLTIATIVSSLYLGILSISRPYKRSDDLYLAFISNLLLTCCFSLGITLQLCDENIILDGDEKACDRFVGLNLNSEKASWFVVASMIGMLVISMISLLVMATNKMRHPTVCLVSTSYPPNLELPAKCKTHVFMSHVWSTGQHKTHAIAHKLSLALPSMKIWLDIDNLHDINNLEQEVSETAVFIIFYSKGYFRSKNCRRELYAAVEMEKPVIVLFEGDEVSCLRELKNECHQFCINEPGSTFILERILKDDPIRWLNEASFCAATMKRVFTRLLANLPYYQGPRKAILRKGIKVPSELSGPATLPFSINLLVCPSNIGALSIAEEIAALLPSHTVNIQLAVTSLTTGKELEHRTEPDTKLDPNVPRFRGYNGTNLPEDYEGTSNGEFSIDGSTDEAKELPNIESTPQDDDDSGISYENEDLSENNFSIEINSNSNQGSTNSKSLLRIPKRHVPPSLTLSKDTLPKERCALLLYLDCDFFLDDEINLSESIKSAKRLNIPIFLVHEQDMGKGGCPFSIFFDQTPQELIDPPYEIFSGLAVPLYTQPEYRDVSLREIIENIELSFSGKKKDVKARSLRKSTMSIL